MGVILKMASEIQRLVTAHLVVQAGAWGVYQVHLDIRLLLLEIGGDPRNGTPRTSPTHKAIQVPAALLPYLLACLQMCPEVC